MKLTAKQKIQAIQHGASTLNALVSGGCVFSMMESARSSIASKIEAAGKPELLASLFFDDDEDEDEAAQYRVSADGTAIIPVYGVLIDAAPEWWHSWFGLTSTPQLTQWARQAKADANVKRVFQDIESPGGQMSGMANFTDAIFDLSATGKPVWSMCRQACSCGYWAASQGDKIIARRDADIGCIGSRIVLLDWSENYKQVGIRAVPITSSGAEKYKTAGLMGTEITPEQEANFKRYADEGQALFNAGIIRGRGISSEQAQEWADGRYYLGYAALPMGLVDEVGDPDAILAQFGEETNGSKQPPPDDVDVTEYEATRRKNKQNAVKSKTIVAQPAQTGTKTVDELIKKVKTTLFGGSETADEKQDAAAHTIADLTTKLGQTQTDLKAAQTKLREIETAEQNKNATALTAAKASAKKMALTAFEQGTQDYKDAETLIEAQTDPVILATFTRGYEAQAKAAGVGNTTRTTAGGDPATEPDDVLLAKLQATQKAGQKANNTAPKPAGGN